MGNFFWGKKEWKSTRKTAAKYKAYQKLGTGLNHYFLHRAVKFIRIRTTVTHKLLGALDICSKAQLKTKTKLQNVN